MTDETAPLSEKVMVWLSAYVDGVLNDTDRAFVEQLAQDDPRVAEEIEALFALNDDLRDALGGLLDAPVPASLSAVIEPEDAVTAPMPEQSANTNAAPFRWRSLAASLMIGAVLGAAAMWSLQSAAPSGQVAQAAPKRSWLGEVAEYHQVYARQKRHLVEVPASEKSHIEKWMSKETGTAVTVPDFSNSGWTFQGARLLVAAGKPVAQLMYTNSDGDVVALCILKNASGSAAPIGPRSFGEVTMVTWKSETGSFALIGAEQEVLKGLAEQAQPLI